MLEFQTRPAALLNLVFLGGVITLNMEYSDEKERRLVKVLGCCGTIAKKEHMSSRGCIGWKGVEIWLILKERQLFTASIVTNLTKWSDH